jgi:hypothetical protein
MAKKKATEKAVDTDRYVRSAQNRRGDVNVEMLKKQCLRLAQLSARIGARAAQMEERGIDSLSRVDGHRKFAHGQEKIEAYISQVDKNYQKTVHGAEEY